MPSAVVDAAFKAKLAASWTVGPVIGGSGVNDPPDHTTDPPTGVDAFVAVQYPVVNAEKPVLGGRYFEEGAARLVLNVKREIDLAQGLAWGDTLAALFRGSNGQNQKFGGVEAFAPSAPIINDANDDGNWFELAVIVPYRYQFSA